MSIFMEDRELVSIIVPCYNQAVYLPECLSSVLHQAYIHWECIIVNDASPDDTAVVALEWCRKDARFRYIALSDNKGLAGARNAGIAQSNGTYILPLDADDKIAPSYLQLAIAVVTANPDVKLVYGRAEYFDGETGPWPLPSYRYGLLFTQNPIYCTAMYCKADWVLVGGYTETLKLGLEDWDFWLKLLSPESKVVCLDEVVFFYRRRQESMISTLTQNEQVYDVFWETMMKQHLPKWRKWSRVHLRFLLDDHIDQRAKLQRIQQNTLARIFYKFSRILAGIK
jgi:glycosyltransferase involved in cell wall biosynthesis